MSAGRAMKRAMDVTQQFNEKIAAMKNGDKK